MIHDWQSSAEVVLGLLIEQKVSPNKIVLEELPQDFARVARAIKDDPLITKAELVKSFGVATISGAIDAVHNLNGLGDADWLEINHNSYVKYEVSTGLKSAAARLERGFEIDVPYTIESLSRLSRKTGRMVRMLDVEPVEMSLIRTGVKSVDYHIGGVPQAGLVTVVGPTKVGKTSFVLDLLINFVRVHKTKTAALFTKEMLEGQCKKRALEICPDVSDDVQSRIWMNHDAKSVGEVASLASTTENLGIVAVDFADLLISGIVDPAKMEEVYRVLALLATQLGVPVILLAQFSGSYQGGVPKPNDIRWTRMAEALSWTVWILYAPSRYWYAEEKHPLLPSLPGKAYVVVWICRSKTNNELPGAIQLSWNGETGWSKNRGKWFSLQQSKNSKAEMEEDDEEWSKEYAEG